jgi:hypothetical protein
MKIAANKTFVYYIDDTKSGSDRIIPICTTAPEVLYPDFKKKTNEEQEELHFQSRLLAVLIKNSVTEFQAQFQNNT